MPRTLKALLAIAFLLLTGLGVVWYTDSALWLAAQILKPRHGHDLQRKAQAPDYSTADAWAALPSRQDLSDMVPAGVKPRRLGDRAPADAFFIHPTTYIRGEDWNDPMRRDTATEENLQWVLANQASAFNGCCDVYAPRFRQTSIFHTYADEETRLAARELAYSDVERAFDHFIEHLSEGRPFVIAGHSQGTSHARTLIERRIEGSDLADRIVALYIIGGGVLEEDFSATDSIRPCGNETDLSCVVHWSTYGDGGQPSERSPSNHLLCTNPLSWRTDGDRVDRTANEGAVVPSGTFNIRFWGEDAAEGVMFEPLGAPHPKHTWAQCRDGYLFVEPQEGNGFESYGLGPGLNYHGLDYALFYMDVRENAKRRVATWLDAKP